MTPYTHKGWFSFCPVYVGNPYSNAPDVMARREWLEPLLRLAIKLQGVAINTCLAINPDWEPTWHIQITGKIQ